MHKLQSTRAAQPTPTATAPPFLDNRTVLAGGPGDLGGFNTFFVARARNNANPVACASGGQCRMASSLKYGSLN